MSGKNGVNDIAILPVFSYTGMQVVGVTAFKRACTAEPAPRKTTGGFCGLKKAFPDTRKEELD
jgi:hypothetical protein